MKNLDNVKIIECLQANDPSLVTVICAASGQQAAVSQAFNARSVGFCAKPYRDNIVKRTLKELDRQPVWY